MVNCKVLLCFCLTFIPFNNGQIRVMDHEDSFQLSPFDMDQFYQEPEPLLSQARDPVQLFLKLGEIMGEVKNGRGSMLKSGRYSPKDGGRSIRISNMGQLAEKFQWGRPMPRAAMRIRQSETWKRTRAWLESRLNLPNEEEEIEYFKNLGSFPGTHYMLPPQCLKNMTYCPDNGFGVRPVGFIMDRGMVNQCPQGNIFYIFYFLCKFESKVDIPFIELDLTNNIPEFVLTHFTDDTCTRKQPKVCFYCRVGENQYESSRFCKLNLNPEPEACRRDQEYPIDGDEADAGWIQPGTEKRFSKMRLPGDRERLPTWYHGARSLDRIEMQQRTYGEDYLKVAGLRYINVVKVLGHCSDCS